MWGTASSPLTLASPRNPHEPDHYWLARHAPQGPGGRQAALIDIAQDLLLTRLYERGVFDHLLFKGGTALERLQGMWWPGITTAAGASAVC